MIVDLGVYGSVVRVGDRVFASAIAGLADASWAVWDVPTRTQLAKGPFEAAQPSVQAGKFAVTVGQNTELRRVTDGALLGVATGVRGAQLSSDASYLWNASSSGVTAWSLSGDVIATWPGTYVAEAGIAGPDALRFFTGPRGANVLEALTLSDQSSHTKAYEGTFRAWFADGSRFITTVGDSIRVYSKDAVQEQLLLVSANLFVGGFGDYFWVASGTANAQTFQVFRVGSATALATQSGLSNARYTSAPGGVIIGKQESFDWVDLRGADPVTITHALASAPGRNIAVDPDGNWVTDGSPLRASSGPDGASVSLGCGSLQAAAGTSSGRVALATSDDHVRVFDIPDSKRLVADISTQAGGVGLSQDGTILVVGPATDSIARTVLGPTSIKVYAIPSGALQHEWTSTSSTIKAFALAAHAPRVAELACSATSCTRRVTDLEGTTVFTTTATTQDPPGNAPGFMSLSPDGTKLAFTVVAQPSVLFHDPVTYIFSEMQLVGSLTGDVSPPGFLDDAHILAERVGRGVAGFRLYSDTVVVDSSGTVLATVAQASPPSSTYVPGLAGLGLVGYAGGSGRIYSLTGTGGRVTTHGYGVTVAGGYAITTIGSQVLAEPLP